jgi:hypothetical protein
VQLFEVASDKFYSNKISTRVLNTYRNMATAVTKSTVICNMFTIARNGSLTVP